MLLAAVAQTARDFEVAQCVGVELHSRRRIEEREAVDLREIGHHRRVQIAQERGNRRARARVRGNLLGREMARKQFVIGVRCNNGNCTVRQPLYGKGAHIVRDG